MTVTVYMDEAGAVWIANVQGDILAEGFFKTEDETEDALRHMGYPELSEVFLEVCRERGHGPTAVPQRDDTP